MPRYTLSFISTTISFEVAEDAQAAFAPVLRFFRHITSPACTPAPDFHVTVRGYDPHTDVPAHAWQTELGVIRVSTAPEFTFHAHRLRRPGRITYVNRTTMIDAPARCDVDNRFVVSMTAGSTIQVIDWIRDLVVRTEETRGTVVLHAGGARRDNAVVAIAGAKGAGKTTTLLSMLSDGDEWQYFSGDKLFCRPAGDSITVYPWRDYPHVGVGTIRAQPSLERWVKREFDPALDARPPDHKLLIDPDRLESWLESQFTAAPRTLAAIVLPEGRPAERPHHSPIEDDNAKWALLNTIVERTCDTTFFTWQTYLVPDYTRMYRTLARMRRALPGIAVASVRGRVSAELLQRLDSALATSSPAPRAAATAGRTDAVCVSEVLR